MPLFILDEEIEVEVVGTVEVFLPSVGIGVVGVTALCQEVGQIDGGNLLAGFLVANDEERIVLGSLMPDEAVESDTGMRRLVDVGALLVFRCGVPLAEGCVYEIVVRQQGIVVCQLAVVVYNEEIEVLGSDAEAL